MLILLLDDAAHRRQFPLARGDDAETVFAQSGVGKHGGQFAFWPSSLNGIHSGENNNQPNIAIQKRTVRRPWPHTLRPASVSRHTVSTGFDALF